jgi:PH (Pleckstrin Homology) domain-containing protein
VGYLKDGARFSVPVPKLKGKTIFVRLMPNGREIRYQKPQESAREISAQLLTESLDITKGFQVLTGAQSPFWTPGTLKKADPSAVDNTLTILTTQPDPADPTSTEPARLDLLALDRQSFVNWSDGLRALAGASMINAETSEEVDALVEIDFTVQLLDDADKPPPVPVPPDDFDFVENKGEEPGA